MKVFLDVTQCTLLYLYARSQTFRENMLLLNLGFVGPCIFTHTNESTNHMQQSTTGPPSVVQAPLNMFRATLCPSSRAYQLQQ
jgi:hypothetical protein